MNDVLCPFTGVLHDQTCERRSLSRISNLLVGVLGALGLLFAFAGASRAAAGPTFDIGSPSLTDIWVDPVRGNDSASGASRTQALRSITAAWHRVPDAPGTRGTRIQLMAGNYPESHYPQYWERKKGSLAAPIILQSADGTGKAHLTGFLNFFDVAYLYLIGLDAHNTGDVLHCERCDHLLIRSSTLTGGARQAHETIKINQSRHIYIEDSDVGEAYENAIDFVAVQYGHIVRNRIHDGDDWCIYLKGGSAYFTIEGNRIYHCGTGGFSAGQGTGFEYMQPPWLHYEAYALRVVNNVIYETEGAGFGVNGGYDVLLAYNTLYRVGQRSHVLEFVFGSRSCDGDAALPSGCADHLSLGGWGTARTSGDGEPIPNRNVFVYNNVVYNPAGIQSQWQHFAVYGPRSPSPGSHIPTPARTDENLRIQGNLIWNGPADHPLGIGDDSGCQPPNLTCNAAQLTADNRINAAMPLLVDPDDGDFHPVPRSVLFNQARIAIPAFPAWDVFKPPVPVGLTQMAVETDFDGVARSAGTAIGAFAGTHGPAAQPDLVVTTISLSPTAPVAGNTFSADVRIKNQGTATSSVGLVTIWTDRPGVPACRANGNKSVALGAIAPGQTARYVIAGLTADSTGRKTLRAFVDSACAIAESAEANNHFTSAYSVVGPPRPDFLVSAAALSPPIPRAGRSFQAIVTVSNQGSVAGDAGQLAVWADRPQMASCRTVGNKSAAVGRLGAGQSRTITLSGLRVISSGSKTLRAFVDSSCMRAEASESNNQRVMLYRAR